MTATAISPVRWRDQAKCLGQPLNTMFEFDKDDTKDGYRTPADVEALRDQFCNRCPVRVECLNDSLDHNEDYGIAGGLTPEDRKKITQLVCSCGNDIDPLDMLDRNRRHFCPSCSPIVFERTVSFGV